MVPESVPVVMTVNVTPLLGSAPTVMTTGPVVALGGTGQRTFWRKPEPLPAENPLSQLCD